MQGLKDWLRRFKFEDLIVWLQITGSHPANQKYTNRIAMLTACVLSIEADGFQGKQFKRKDCISLFGYVEANYRTLLEPVEDCESLDQHELVPFCWKEEEYYFYYGILESPYEQIENFRDIYAHGDAVFEAWLEASLRFQTQLLSEVLNLREATAICSKTYLVYVPSEYYFKRVYPHFVSQNGGDDGVLEMPVMESGSLKESFTSLRQACEDYNLFQSIRIALSQDKECFLWPGWHIEVLYSLASTRCGNSEEIRARVHDNCRRTLLGAALNLFTIRTPVQAILAPTGADLISQFDYAFYYGQGNIFLLKQAAPFHSIEHYEGELKDSVQRIRNHDVVFVQADSSRERAFGVPTKLCEIITILIVPLLRLTPEVYKSERRAQTLLVHLPDMRRICELFKSPRELVDFVRSDYELQQNTRILCWDYLDRVIYYIKNKHSYLKAGRWPGFIYFEAHSWSRYYHEKILGMCRNGTYRLIRKYWGDFFNEIREDGERRVRYVNTGTLTAGFATKFENALVMFSLPPDGYLCRGEEIKMSEFLADFFSYFFGKLGARIYEAFGQAIKAKQFLFLIWPVSYARRSKLPNIEVVAFERNDVPCKFVRAQCPSEPTVVLFDCDSLAQYFSTPTNACERDAFAMLLQNLPWVSENVSETKAYEFIDRHLPCGKKAYSCDVIETANVKCEHYSKPLLESPEAAARIERLIAEYLFSTGIKPGCYDNARARELLGLMFNYLQAEIVAGLARLSRDTLKYIYEQVDSIEYAHTTKEIRAGIDSQKHVDFDVCVRFADDINRLSRAGIAAKYLLTQALKQPSTGTKVISETEWQNLLAMSLQSIDMSWLIDMLKYELSQHRVEISELYEVRHTSLGTTMNMSEFASAEAGRRIRKLGEDCDAEEETVQKKNHGPVLTTFLQKLDRMFLAERGFRFMDMVSVLYALGSHPMTDHGVISEVTEEDLAKFLASALKDCPEPAQLQKIIDFVSTGREHFQGLDILVPTQMFRHSKRVNICPLIEERGRVVFGNEMCVKASKLWLSLVSEGEMPYREDSALIKRLVEDFRQQRDRALEERAEDIAKRAVGKENVLSRVAKFDRISKALPKRPRCGEIDLLIVNRQLKVIYVLDAKNRVRALTPHDVHKDFNRFFLSGERSYLAKLQKKATFVEEHLATFLQYFGVTEPVDWKLRTGFVVNQNHQISHQEEQKTDFIEVRKLASYLHKA